jgi:transcriptional regulator with XRE-family HTH domain
MRIEEVIGKRIKEAREHDGLSQDQVGRAMARYLGKPWPNQQVSVAEDGGRKFTAAELFALCMVLRRPASYLFIPSAGDVIEVDGTDQRVPGHIAFVLQVASSEDDLQLMGPSIQALVGPLASRVVEAEKNARLARELVEEIERVLAAVVQKEES